MKSESKSRTTWTSVKRYGLDRRWATTNDIVSVKSVISESLRDPNLLS